MDQFLSQINISRQRLQARHAQGECECLLGEQEECLFLPNIDHDGGDDEQHARDAQWSPLIGYLEHPEVVYKAVDIITPVLHYMQERQRDDRVLTIQDVKLQDLIFYYSSVWNTQS